MLAALAAGPQPHPPPAPPLCRPGEGRRGGRAGGTAPRTGPVPTQEKQYRGEQVSGESVGWCG